jgi:predicted P-loop ATPase
MVGTLPLRDREGAGLYGDSLRALAALVHRFGPDDAAAICREAGWEHPHHWRPADKVHELAAADHPERAEIGTLIHLARGAGWQYETSVAVKQASRRSSNRPLLRAVRGGAAADTGTPPAEGEPQLPQQTGRPRRYKLSPHDIRRELPNRLGKFRRNNRTGEIESENGRLPANQLSRLYVSLCSDTETWPKEATCDTLEVLADENAYDPVAEYLERITAAPLPMDQWERLDRHLLGIDDPIAAAFLPRYLMSAVARTIDPGCDVRQSPVLVGPQWRGKTALGRILFGPDAFVSGVEGLDRDAIQRCHTAWGVELAELDGVTRRSDKEKLKAFLTETTDTIQLKYDKHPAKFHRRFVFWGTANRAPLNDATGSTRFVVIMLPDRDLPLDWAAANRDAIWARALQQLRSGIEWWRTSEEEKRAVAERNAAATIADPWADAVAEILEAHQRRESGPITFPRILSDQRIDLPTAQHNKSHVERVRTIAESLGWQHGRRRSGGSQPRTGLWPPDPVEQQQQPDTPQAADMPPSSTAEDSPSPAPSAAPRLALSGNPPAIGTPAEICTAGQWRNGYRVEAVGTGYVRLVKPGGRPTEMRLETEGITWRRC